MGVMEQYCYCGGRFLSDFNAQMFMQTLTLLKLSRFSSSNTTLQHMCQARLSTTGTTAPLCKQGVSSSGSTAPMYTKQGVLVVIQHCTITICTKQGVSSSGSTAPLCTQGVLEVVLQHHYILSKVFW